MGLRHFAFSGNIYPVGDKELSPYELKFNEGPFPGIRAPLMARVRFIKLPPLADAKETHRISPNKVWGVFLGWVQAPGGKWTGRYQCAALTEFIGMDLRVGGHIRVQEVCEVDFDERDIFFPLKAMYDRAHGTLEGLSAPHGTIGDVAPQGLKDLGVTEDTGPVGQQVVDGNQLVMVDAPATDDATEQDLAREDREDVELFGTDDDDDDSSPDLIPPSDSEGEAEPDSTPRRPVRRPVPRTTSEPSSSSRPAHAAPSDSDDIPEASGPGPADKPPDWPECVPWPIPSHWSLTKDAKALLPRAQPFLRPDGTAP